MRLASPACQSDTLSPSELTNHMSGPGAEVGGGNNPFNGGTLTRAGQPTGVGGSFGNPGAGGFPQPGVPGILSARNNSGSNVRIPYSRLVPLQSRQTKKVAGGGPLNGRSLQNEYDGLESGELGWILGRRFLSGSGEQSARVNFNDSAHGMGMGKGVDRMQRLASTPWMEHYFKEALGKTNIDLSTLRLVGPNTAGGQGANLVPEIAHYRNALAGATVIGSVDLPHLANSLFSKAPNGGQVLKYFGAPSDAEMKAPLTKNSFLDNDVADINANAPRGYNPPAAEGYASGIFVMEKGPFLRGKIVDDQPVETAEPGCRSAVSNTQLDHTQPRNLGDTLAFEALYAQMRVASLLDWSPDGMILSKLESPSGDPYGSAELDARQAQLFNVAIQGPALAKTWTGDPMMQTMPMDKVFVVIVADVVTKLSTDKTAGLGNVNATQALWGAWKAWEGADRPSNEGVAEYDKLLAAFKAADAEITASADVDVDGYTEALSALRESTVELDAAVGEGEKSTAREKVTAARGKLDGYFANMKEDAFDNVAAQLKRGEIGVKKSVMTNFRLKRMTSSFMAQYSHYKSDTPSSRCGLKIGTKTPDVANDSTVAAEYIVGGWCVGTVLDNSASRSTVGHQVRIAPASMALNINVNVEWWSSDKMYRNFMDVDGSVLRRDMYMKADDQNKHIVGQQVAAANKREKTAVRQELGLKGANA